MTCQIVQWLREKNNFIECKQSRTYNLLFVNKSIKSTHKCFPYFIIGLHFQEICIDMKLAGL